MASRLGTTPKTTMHALGVVLRRRILQGVPSTASSTHHQQHQSYYSSISTNSAMRISSSSSSSSSSFRCGISVERTLENAATYLTSKRARRYALPIFAAPSRFVASRYNYSTTTTMLQSEWKDNNADAEEVEDLGPNPGLESVIGQGMTSLERTATEVQAKTKKATLASYGKSRKSTTTPRQLAESQRILDAITDCLDGLCERRDPSAAGLIIGGEPIVVLEVQVNSNAKQAKVFWTLPYGILTDERLTPTVYKRFMDKVEHQFVEEGAGKVLARQVHTRLRSYYPPRLKFQPAPATMMAQAMGELFLEDE